MKYEVTREVQSLLYSVQPDIPDPVDIFEIVFNFFLMFTQYSCDFKEKKGQTIFSDILL